MMFVESVLIGLSRTFTDPMQFIYVVHSKRQHETCNLFSLLTERYY